jgi:hypothetical protein
LLSRKSAKRRAARIGPTQCELDGPMPIVNSSKMLIVMRHRVPMIAEERLAALLPS